MVNLMTNNNTDHNSSRSNTRFRSTKQVECKRGLSTSQDEVRKTRIDYNSCNKSTKILELKPSHQDLQVRAQEEESISPNKDSLMLMTGILISN